MSLVERNHVIKQVAAAATDPTLGNTILPRTANRSSDCLETDRFDSGFNLEAELRIVIEDEMLILMFVWKGVTQLLHHPTACGMLGNTEVQNAPTVNQA